MRRKNLTRVTSLVLGTALTVGLTGGALAFSDMGSGSAYAAAVDSLYARGLAKGTVDDAFRPEASLTQAELAVFLNRIAGADADESAAPTGMTADGWSGGALSWAAANDLIDGTLGQYAPLTVDQANDILGKFAALLGIEAVSVAAAGETVTRGEAAAALDTLAGAGFVRVKAAKYVTVTTAEDWGPAIGKVVVDLGAAVDPESVTADAFKVSSVRTVPSFDPATFQSTPAAPQTAARTVTAAYVCDETGAAATSGSHVALEMKIGPDLTASSPFNYDIASGFNSYIDTSYVVALQSGKTLKSADGAPLSLEPTTPAGYTGNATLLADDFDTDGEYSYDQDGTRIDLTYASWVPHENAAKGSTPLIIWLHGAGEGGTDPYINIIGNKVVNLITDDIQQFYGTTGAEILAPQTPTMWLDKDGTGTYMTPTDSGCSYYTKALMGLIETYVAAHPEIDADRIYLGGCSNGGYMTVNMLVEYPDYFAAAYPVCEAYDAAWMTDAKLAKLVETPIWITAAKTDGTVSIFKGASDPDNYAVYDLELDADGNPIPLDNFSNDLYDRLVAAGAKDVHYSLFDKVVDTTGKYLQADGVTPYEYMGHWSWLYALNNECVEKIGGKDVSLFQWLSEQSR